MESPRCKESILVYWRLSIGPILHLLKLVTIKLRSFDVASRIVAWRRRAGILANMDLFRLLVGYIEFKLQRYFVACLIQEWNQRTTRRRYSRLLKSFVGYVEFKLQRYFVACLIQGWRAINDLALTHYTRSLGHTSTRRLRMHMRTIAQMIAAYRAIGLIQSWRQTMRCAVYSTMTSYTPRMAYIRSTLHKILGFRMLNLVLSWQTATLDNLLGHFLEHTAESYMRSTLHKILDFHMLKLVQSWHQAMLDATYGDFEYDAWFSHWTHYGLAGYL